MHLAVATSGPGATNLTTGIATAFMDSIPMVAITANVPDNLIGRDAFQEVAISNITIPITKHTYLVRNINNLESALRNAFRIANSGRKGPVLVDITKDVTAATINYKPGKPMEINPAPAFTEAGPAVRNHGRTCFRLPLASFSFIHELSHALIDHPVSLFLRKTELPQGARHGFQCGFLHGTSLFPD